MKSILLSLALAAGLGSLPALAQAAEQTHWHAVLYSPDLLVTMDIHGASRTGDIVTAEVATYLPQTTSPTGNAEVDFMSSLWEFDCSQKNTVRTIKIKGFVVNVGPATFEEDNDNAPWRTTGTETASGQSWLAACKGTPEGTALYDVTTHEQVLARYRNALSR